jgi:predicted exporter
MTSPARSLNLPLLALTVLFSGVLFWLALSRLTISADILNTLPSDEPVVADARYVLQHHPMQEQVVVDLTHPGGDRQALLQAATLVQRRMRDSGLFAGVGLDEVISRAPALLEYTSGRLPLLFSASELDSQVAPLLSAEKVQSRLAARLARLHGLEGVGEASQLAGDPLGLATLVLARLANLSPTARARFEQGQLVSPEGDHLLILARPMHSGTDPEFARRAKALFDSLAAELRHGPSPQAVQLTSAGAFRAALDNESLARRDTWRAGLLSSVGIALLLLLAFPRPAIGLLAFLPALFSTAAGLWAYSLVFPTISPISLGLGGAIFSIAIDHGIAYLLFMDRPGMVGVGERSSREIWAVGAIAMLTTVGAFLSLCLSGFAILGEVGLFTSLCGLFAFLFVHLLFPRICPRLPAAAANRQPVLQRLLDSAARRAVRPKAWAMIGLTLALASFAAPEVRIDLRAMNSLRPETRADEQRIIDAWGNFMSRIYLLAVAPDPERLLAQSDAVAERLETELAAGRLSSFFVGSALFPGPRRAAANFAAWRAFWHPQRVAALHALLAGESAALGFAPRAFAPFWQLVEARQMPEHSIPEALLPLAGIVAPDGPGPWRQLVTLTPGPGYQAGAFFAAFGGQPDWRCFDPGYFASRLGEYLARTFTRMLVLLGLATALLVLVFLLDVQLTAIALLPIVLATVAALGSLKLLGRPLDIPTLMLSVAVTGIGVDYCVLYVCSHQRYLDPNHPDFSLVRMAIFQAAAATLFGFGALLPADHAMLRSAGLSAFLGIGFTLLGTFALLPALLERTFAPQPWPAAGGSPGSMVRQRFRHMPAAMRLRAWLRPLNDPLPEALVQALDGCRHILVLPCGCGELAAWVLARLPECRLTGVEPEPQRRAVASRIIGARGVVHDALAHATAPVEAVVLPERWQALDDDQLRALIRQAAGLLAPAGRLILGHPAGGRAGRGTTPAPVPERLRAALAHADLRLVERRAQLVLARRA